MSQRLEKGGETEGKQEGTKTGREVDLMLYGIIRQLYL